MLSVVGARPQFIKVAAFSKALSELYGDSILHQVIHTGQHFDENMSSHFFDQFGLPDPDFRLKTQGGTQSEMTAEILRQLEPVMLGTSPDVAVVFGDTNSTLAGALSAAKLGIPLAHVEAGLRSHNWAMPEEINRIVTDRISRFNFAPTFNAMKALESDGLSKTAHLVGDIMLDALNLASNLEPIQTLRVEHSGLEPYILATVHRQGNTDDQTRLRMVCAALLSVAKEVPVVLPMHPRLRIALHRAGLLDSIEKSITVLEPQPFFEMVQYLKRATVLLTDSGGLQKEAFFLKVPCVTLRNETEWTETLDSGWNVLHSLEADNIHDSISKVMTSPKKHLSPYGDGKASQKIAEVLLESLG